MKQRPRFRFRFWLLLFAIACASPVADDGAPEQRKKFIVMLEGRNLVLEYEGRPARFGFSVTRDVIASNAEEAGEIAIQGVRADQELNATLLNAPDDPPRYTVTHHIEVQSFDAIPKPDLGYIFYRDHDTR